MSDRKILFVVEGLSDEPKFIRRLLQVCYSSQQFKTYSYKTNIHVLAKRLEDEYPDFENEDIDIQLILRQFENNEKQRELLSAHYTDIFLIFDFEPRDHTPQFDTIKRMLSYFNDSTTRGKLFINYPMMQSYKHFPKLPFPEFKNEAVSCDDCKKYKEQVSKISQYTDLAKYDYPLFMSLAVHHLCKANFLMTGIYKAPTVEEYLLWEMSQIFDVQVSTLYKDSRVFILNTCIFILCDYKPNAFFRQLTDRKQQFLI